MELVRLDYGLMCRNDSCMYGCKVAFLMYILTPFCRKCGWLCIFHEEFCEKDKFAYHIVDIKYQLYGKQICLSSLDSVFKPMQVSY